jgi:hypothetical protein
MRKGGVRSEEIDGKRSHLINFLTPHSSLVLPLRT